MVWLSGMRWFPMQTRYKVSPSRYQKRMMYKRLAAKYFGRRRNCFSITIRTTQRALRYSTQSRKLRQEELSKLWETRITAACLEHNMDKNYFMTALAESNIAVNRQVLADLSIYEPRTFQIIAVAMLGFIFVFYVLPTIGWHALGKTQNGALGDTQWQLKQDQHGDKYYDGDKNNHIQAYNSSGESVRLDINDNTSPKSIMDGTTANYGKNSGSGLKNNWIDQGMVDSKSGRKKEKDVRFRKTDRVRRLRKKRKQGRNNPNYGYKQPICKTVSKYTVLTEVENIFGETVEIAPVVGLDGAIIGLHFYESYCSNQHERCMAINRKQYYSSCETDYRYTYAPIIKDGKVVYEQIKIRGGCSCILQSTKKNYFISILDFID